MQKKHTFKIHAILSASFLATASMAYAHGTNVPKMVSGTATIKGLAQVIDGASHASKMPVLFPTKIPAAKNPLHLYASFSSYISKPDFNQFWQINVGATPTCKGAHFCNVGYLSAQKDGKFEATFGGVIPNTNKQPKEPVTLKNGTVAYFTPGHAEGDFHPATLEWVMNNVLYTLTWNAKEVNEKNVLTTMANSALPKK